MERTNQHRFGNPSLFLRDGRGRIGRRIRRQPQVQRGALRARLKHLQRLGLPGLKAGKGTRVRYNDMQAHQWLIAILLIEAFVDPTIAAQVIHQYWTSHLARWIGQAVDDPESLLGNHLLLCLRPKLMEEIWRAQIARAAIEAFASLRPGPSAQDQNHRSRPAEAPSAWQS